MYGAFADGIDFFVFFFSSRRRHTRLTCDWSSDVCSSDLGLLFGMSNPAEPPGDATCIDEQYLALIRERLADLVPVTAGLGLRTVWAATIDYTPDHLPIIGPARGTDQILNGVVVASAGGAGMMWGPAVARAAADVALTGRSDVVDTAQLGLDRFDADGRSRLATDPIALPFPEQAPYQPGKLTIS